MGIPRTFIPESVERLLLMVEEPLHDLRCIVEVVRASMGRRHNYFVYICCLVCALLMAASHWIFIESSGGLVWSYLNVYFWAFLGTALMFMHLPFATRMKTRLYAYRHCHVYRHRRLEGGPAHH